MLAFQALSIPTLCLALITPEPLAQQTPGKAAAASEHAEYAEYAGRRGALGATEAVLFSLRNFSAPGMTGATWVEVDSRQGAKKARAQQGLGGGLPMVHIDSLHTRLIERRGEEPPRYRVEVDLVLSAEDGPVVAARMLEDLMESFDKLNGPLDVSLKQTLLDSENSLHVTNLVIELPVDEAFAPPQKFNRPLSYIVQRVTDSGVPTSALRIRPTTSSSKDEVRRFITIDQSGAGNFLTSASCGALLRGLGSGQDALPMTVLSISRGADTPAGTDAWNLMATLLVGNS